MLTLTHTITVENEDYLLEMDFGNFTFDTDTVDGSSQCSNITILDDEIFEKFQVIVLTLGESTPSGVEMNESLKVNIIDDGNNICC